MWPAQGKQLVFGSELKTLLASGLIERRLDPASLRIYLQLGHVPPPLTMIRGVQPLRAGTCGHMAGRRVDHSKLLESQTLRIASGYPCAQDALASELSDVLLDAMKKHLVADVPIVLFLSGGADSACLGGLARSAGAQNLRAMTVGFAEEEFDETNLTRRTALALDLPLEVVTLAPAQVIGELDHAIWALDQPSVDGLNSYWISKLAAGRGLQGGHFRAGRR
jgi:asparagine synthase (glutamine-hydrolysing)